MESYTSHFREMISMANILPITLCFSVKQKVVLSLKIQKQQPFLETRIMEAECLCASTNKLQNFYAWK